MEAEAADPSEAREGLSCGFRRPCSSGKCAKGSFKAKSVKPAARAAMAKHHRLGGAATPFLPILEAASLRSRRGQVGSPSLTLARGRRPLPVSSHRPPSACLCPNQLFFQGHRSYQIRATPSTSFCLGHLFKGGSPSTATFGGAGGEGLTV